MSPAAVLVRGLKDAARAGVRRLPLRNRLFTVARALGAPRSVTRHLPVEGPFDVRVDGRGVFRLEGHGLPAENELFWTGLAGCEERESLRWWVRLAQSASVIVDVGAYLGVYSLAAQAANPDARVFGFEPLRSSFDLFEANCAANASGVTAVRAAIGDRDGEADLYYGDGSDTASLGRAEGRRFERVPIRTLESYLEQQSVPRVDLLKVDVETFEPAVLAGMGGLLERSRPSMILEVLQDDVGRELERLSPPGYAYFHIDESRGLVRRERVGRVSHGSRNYLFCDESVARTLEGE